MQDTSAAENLNAKAPGTSHLRSGDVVEQVLNESLFQPVRKLLQRPSKNLRASLVRTGFYLGSLDCERAPTLDETHSCQKLADVLEAVHAGSLIIDDIQDGSKERRGAPSLHLQYGVAKALNAGNWLYFQPFDWIKRLKLHPMRELAIYRLCHEAMLNAHLGQAIDLGSRIDKVDQSQVANLCLKSLQLKTGSLTSLALSVGAALACHEGGLDESRAQALASFGLDLGIGLQMFDDIGNLSLPEDDPKRLEDLRLRRPTWFWAIAAEHCNDFEFRSLFSALEELPDEGPLFALIDDYEILSIARARAQLHIESAFDQLEDDIGGWHKFPEAYVLLSELAERIRTSYGR